MLYNITAKNNYPRSNIETVSKKSRIVDYNSNGTIETNNSNLEHGKLYGKRHMFAIALIANFVFIMFIIVLLDPKTTAFVLQVITNGTSIYTYIDRYLQRLGLKS